MKIHTMEITNRCNEDCWFCAHSRMQRPQGDISMNTVSVAISKMVAMGQTSVCLFNLGESLLHPKFFEISDMVADAGISPTLILNSKTLNDGLINDLKQSRLSDISISMDFAGDRENDLVDHIIDDPRVSVNLKGITRAEIVEFRKRWGTKAKIKFINDFAGLMDYRDCSAAQNCFFRNNNYCTLLWDGRISACIYDIDGNYILGTIDEIDNLHHRKEYDLCKKCMGLDERVM